MGTAAEKAKKRSAAAVLGLRTVVVAAASTFVVLTTLITTTGTAGSLVAIGLFSIGVGLLTIGSRLLAIRSRLLSVRSKFLFVRSSPLFVRGGLLTIRSRPTVASAVVVLTRLSSPTRIVLTSLRASAIVASARFPIPSLRSLLRCAAVEAIQDRASWQRRRAPGCRGRSPCTRPRWRPSSAWA